MNMIRTMKTMETKTIRTIRTAFLTAALCTCALVSGATEDAVQLRLSPSIANAPATVVVTATVSRDERNRVLVLSAESEDFLRSSAIELDGDNEARVHQFWLKGLPEGHYLVSAEVRGASGVRALGSVPLEVLGTAVKHGK
jgi:hypothetical protein